tara:strand:- start:385 stop:6732 length:6348 start_codon:yes stop_codon:yes gene_type:complete
MPTSLENFLSSRPDEEIEGIREALRPTTMDKFNYGIDSESFFFEDIYRYIRAGGDKDILDKERQEREEELNLKYPNFTEEDRNSGAALTGSVGRVLLDPAFLATGWLTAPTQIARLSGLGGKLARGAFEASKWGAVTGTATAAHQAVDEGEINPNEIALNTLMAAGIAGPLGMLGRAKPAITKPSTEATEAAAKPVQRGTRREAPSVKETATPESVATGNSILNRFIPEKGTSEYNVLKDFPIFSSAILKAEDAVSALKAAKELKRLKSKKAPNAKELKRLEEEAKEAEKFLDPENLLGYMNEVGEATSGVALKSLEEAAKKGITSPSTISYLITRPLVGAAAGYGVGQTARLITGDDEERMSPWFWIALGVSGGVLSNRLRTASLSPTQKATARESLDDLLRSSLRAQTAMLTAGTTSAANNVLGGWAAKLNRVFAYQFGPGLKGPATVSIEQRKELAISAISGRVQSVGSSSLFKSSTDEAEAIADLIWHHAEGMVNTKSGKHTLASLRKEVNNSPVLSNILKSGRIKDEKELFNIIRQDAKDFKLIEDQFGQEMFRVMPWAKPLEGRVFSQAWDYNKILANPEQARQTLIKAYNIQTSKKLLSEGVKEGSKKWNQKIAVSKRTANKHIDNILETGTLAPAYSTMWKVPKANSRYAKIDPRPLAANLERDRQLVDFDARKIFKDFLIRNPKTLITRQAETNVPVIEFVREFGGKGQKIDAINKLINRDFNALRKAARTPEEKAKLNQLQKYHHKAVETMVNLYFKRHHSQSPLANSNIAHNIVGIATTMANTTMLNKVSITSLGDLILPFQNSGAIKGIRGTLNTLNPKDYSKVLDFAARDETAAELSALLARTANPTSLTQRTLATINEKFFKIVGLPLLTRFSRRQSFNIGVENTFDVAKQVVKNPTRINKLKANSLGLNDDYLTHLNKFESIEDALKNDKAKRILTIGGRMDADFNSLIPTVFNRRAFTQSNNPLIRSLGQFTSWAQAKTSQTNALVKRIEDGDIALAVRMIGALVVYDGILTFRDMLNDPTGSRLEEEGYSSRLEKALSAKQLGRIMGFSGNFGPWYGDRVSSLMASGTSRDTLGNVSPALSWFTDALRVLSPVPYRGLVGSAWRNIGQGDWEGTVKQVSSLLPFGTELEDVSAALGYELEDKTPDQLENERGGQGLYSLAKGGVVENVPQVPEEPDERIDKITGLPYNVQAGTAFIDEEDEEKRTELNIGGIAYNDSLERLGFIAGGVARIGSMFSKSIGKGRNVKIKKTPIQTPAKFQRDAVNQAKRDINIMAEAGDTGEDLVNNALPDAASLEKWRIARIEELESRGWEKGGVPIPERIRAEILGLEEKAANFTSKKISLNEYKKALEDYDKLILEEFAPTIFESVPVPAQALDILSSVRFKKTIPIKERQVVGVNHGIEGGELVSLRLDIPAYNSYDTWVVTIHNAKNAKDHSGRVRAYASTGHIKDVSFGSNPDVSLRIAKGDASKATIARMLGKWQPHNSDDLYRKAVNVLPEANDPRNKEWVQIGMNPYRHSFFYEKTTLRPVKSAEEVIQIGGLVLAKNPVYTTKFHKDFLVRSKKQAKEGEAPETLMHFEKGGIVEEELDRLGYVEGGVATDSLEMIDLESLPKKRPMPTTTLRETLVSSLTPATNRQNRKMFGNKSKAIQDNRWGEVQNNIAYLNNFKFRDAGAENYQQDMLFGESMHNLKTVAPAVHERLYQAALDDPATTDWLQQSYDWARENMKEQREFIPFVRDSRLDQVIGAYFLARPDSPIPTMREWDKDIEGYGTTFRQALEDFKEILDQPFDSEEDRQTFARMTGPEHTGAKTFPLPERGQVEVEQLPSIDLTPAINLDEVYALPEWMVVGANAISDDVGSLITYEESSPTYDRFGGILNYGIDSPQITRQNIKELSDPIQTVLMSQGLNEKGTNQIRTEEDLNEGVHQAFKDAAAVALADGRREVSFHDYGDTDILLPKERWFDENTPRYLSVAASVGDNVDEYNNPLSPEIRKQYTEDRMSVWPFDPKEITSYSTLPSTIESFKNALNNDPKIKAAWSVGRFAVHGDEGNLYMNDYFNFNTKNQMGKDFYSFVRSVLSNIAGLPIEDSELGVQTRVRLD